MRSLLLGFLMMWSLGAAAKHAPLFQGETITGDNLALKTSLKENRLLLVSFWATWCGPCLLELDKVSKHLVSDPSLPMDVLTVNVDTADTSSRVKSTIKQQKIGFPVILDPQHQILGKYNPSKALPFSVLVNSKGEIVEAFTGYDEKLFEKVRRHLAG